MFILGAVLVDKSIGLQMESSNPGQVVLRSSLEEVISETGISIITQCSWSEKLMPAERKDFLDGNMQLMYELGPQFKGYTGLALVVTNPVDECAFCFADASGIDPQRIIGLNLQMQLDMGDCWQCNLIVTLTKYLGI